MRRLPIAAALAALAGSAAAQDRPPLHPMRDVSVAYRTEGAGPARGEMRLSWLHARRSMRMDLPGGAGWTLADMASGRVVMVVDSQRMVLDIPADAPGRTLFQPGPDARFTRLGQETILGHRCTLWRTGDGAQQGEACLTAEGVMLRAEGSAGGHRGAMTATAIAFEPQDPARFRIPEGYRRLPMLGAPPPR